jgi:hypothetical protein
LLLAPPALAQTTCFTDHLGTTICSSPDTVIHGNTSSIGTSVYRDDSGNRLDYDSDPTGKSSLQLPSGESIEWSQPVPEKQNTPQMIDSRQLPPTGVNPATPGSRAHEPPRELPGRH